MTSGTLEYDLHAALLAQAALPPVGVAHPALLDAAAKAVEAARVALVERWDGFAWQQSHKWYSRNRRGDIEDYRSAAQVGLWDAACRFRPELGHQFQTYAGWYLLRYLRPHAQAQAAGGFHVPDHLGFVHLAAAPFGSAGDEDDGDPFAGTIPDHRADDPRESPPDPAAVWAAVERVLAGRPRELLVLRLRFREGLGLKAAAERIGRSRERVRQIEARAIGRLRDRGHMFAGFLDLEGAA